MSTRLVLVLVDRCEFILMPTPRRGETREDFIDRCIPIVIEDGTAEDGRQGFAVCNSMYDQAKKEWEMTEEVETVVEEVKEKPNKGKAVLASVVPFDATTFDDVEEYMKAEAVNERVGEVTRQFETLTHNIMHNPEVSDKTKAMNTLVGQLDSRLKEAIDIGSTTIWDAMKSLFSKAVTKTEGGVSYKVSDYAYVPDPGSPSTWKLRMAEGRSGNITKAQLGRAAAAFSSGGFRGQKVQIPSGDVAKVKRKLRSAYRRLGVKNEDIPDSIKAKDGLFIWKEGDRYRWFAVYSNKFRDDDNPPEIISEKSHIRFVEMVDNGEVPYPELWHWHIPGTRWGEADWIAYDQDFGFSLASGFVDRGHEEEAKAIMDLDEPLAVSHGLLVTERNSDDETVIDGYISQEISDLPVEAAANKLTGFSLIEAKEVHDMIPEEKKAHLLSVGLTDEKIMEIESDLEAKASKADEEGLDYKEAEAPEPETETPEVEATIEEPEAEPQPEGEKEIEVDDLTLPASRQEVLEAITPLTSAINEIAETLSGLKKSDDEKIKEIADDTPAFSIAALVQQDLSVIGKKETETDKVDGPTENEDKSKSITGMPWIDMMLEDKE